MWGETVPTVEVRLVTSSEPQGPSLASSSESSSSSSPPASAGGQYRRKPSRNFPGLVKRSHMGSLASIVTSRPSYNRSSSVTSSNINRPRRPSSLHIPVTQTRSASSAMVSPILSAATRAIHKNLEATGMASGLPFPPLIFPSAEFDPNVLTQGRNGTKGKSCEFFYVCSEYSTGYTNWNCGESTT